MKYYSDVTQLVLDITTRKKNEAAFVRRQTTERTAMARPGKSPDKRKALEKFANAS